MNSLNNIDEWHQITVVFNTTKTHNQANIDALKI